MTSSMKNLGIDRLSVEDRLVLVQEIWDSIALESGHSQLSEAQRDELQRRVADHEKNPDNVVPWDQVKSEALSRLEK